MCDTMVALGNSTADGGVLFAKNSDREPNEAQGLVYRPTAIHGSDETVTCTFVDVPQVRETLAVILSKPFWMFGCEMGANEAGVVAGNEAVFTKMPYEETGLLGMDLMRLGLERADSARGVLKVIVDLLERYGQCALGGHRHRFRYHNSYLIADEKEAYVLETAGRHWVYEKVKDVRAISNGLTIGSTWEDASPHLEEHAIHKGWCKSRSEFHFADCYREPLITFFSASRRRHACTEGWLRQSHGQITPGTMAAILRDHGPSGDDPGWRPEKGFFMQVCAHGAWGPIRGGGSQTTGSMISQLRVGSATHWFTGTSAPCTSVFKPVWFEARQCLEDAFGPEPGEFYDSACRWWRHEELHRATLQDYPTRISVYDEERQQLESELMENAASSGDRCALVMESFARVDAAEQEWTRRVRRTPVRQRPNLLYRRFWERLNRQAAMPHK